MASRALHDCDGAFVSPSDNLDEVDASQVFQLMHTSEIPDKYVRIPGDGVKWAKQPMARPRMVYKDWGRALTQLVEKEGSLVLVTVQEETKLDEAGANRLVKLIQDVAGKHPIQGLRWSPQGVLINFPSVESFEAAGTRLIGTSGKVLKDDTVISLEGAVNCNPPKVYFEFSCHEWEEIQQHLLNVSIPFSTVFTFLEILVDTDAPKPTSTIPTVGITMLFEGTNHQYARRTLRHLSAAPWQQITLNPDVASDLDEGLTYYQNRLGGPVWGVRTGCPQAGVQLTIFVQDVKNLESMVTFYKNLFRVQPLTKITTRSGACYRVFPLSARGELQLVHIPGLRCQVVPNVLVCVQAALEDFEGKSDADILAESRWRLTDPEGNPVCVFRYLAE